MGPFMKKTLTYLGCGAVALGILSAPALAGDATQDAFRSGGKVLAKIGRGFFIFLDHVLPDEMSATATLQRLVVEAANGPTAPKAVPPNSRVDDYANFLRTGDLGASADTLATGDSGSRWISFTPGKSAGQEAGSAARSVADSLVP